LNKIKVLIVEDDPMVIEITREFLKEEPDFTAVGAARSGHEAVELTEKLAPDLILLDNFLPDFNGTAVIERIRAFNKTVDFIMITAAKEVPLVQECFRLGIRDYLIKPYLKQRFLQSLHQYKQFLSTLNQPEVSQSDLDRLNARQRPDETQKGFSQLTEEKIQEILKTKKTGITAEELASAVGITTVSARRYLKLLQDRNQVEYDLIYGKQGRPTYLYRIIEE
jgi:response regulator of citrate/malate metabolism